MQINVQFDRDWFFAEESHMLATNKLITLIRQDLDWNVRVLKKSLNECSLELEDGVSGQEADASIRALIASKICPGSEQNFRLEILDSSAKESAPAADAAAAPESRGQTESAPPADAPAEPPQQSALEQVEALVGVVPFKELCREIVAHAPLVRQNGTQRAFLSGAYLFAGNEGYCCTRATELLSKLLQEESLFTPKANPYVFRFSPSSESPFDENPERFLSSARLVTVDLSNVLDRTHSADFKRFLMKLFRKSGPHLLIFRMPYSDEKTREQVLGDLRDVLSVRPIPFPLFTGEELQELAERELAGFGFRMEPAAWEVYQKLIEQESMDGYFYGIHTVRRLANEMIQAEELAAGQAEAAPGERVIHADTLRTLLAPVSEDGNVGLERLRKMVGMEEITRQVEEIIRLITVSRMLPDAERPAIHMCFTGNPGTGKTTVARAIGEALKEAGVLRIGHFIEHHARDLCGKYVGHTAPLTTSICREAYGSVLFLDEAYSLTSSDSPRDYGREALDVLIAQMENHREELLVIFAGYPDEMNHFLDANPGLRTRIPYHISFPNYSRGDLYQIFAGMVSGRFRCGEGLLARAEAFFDSLPDSLMEDRSFGNGRFVRNLYERLCSKAAMRCSGTDLESMRLEPEDFDSAAAELMRPEGKPGRTARIGF